MDVPKQLELAEKLIKVLTEGCKFVVLMGLAFFAIAAVANPDWVRKKLQDMHLQVKEINLPGVKLVSNDVFDAAKEVSSAKVAVLEAQRRVVDGDARRALDSTLDKLDAAQDVLASQDEKVRQLLRDNGANVPKPPTQAWVYVGLLSDSKGFVPALEVDPAGTRVEGGAVKSLALRAEKVIFDSGDDCAVQRLEDVPPPPADLPDRVVFMLGVQKGQPYKVVANARCSGTVTQLYAKVDIPEGAVRFAKFAEGKRPH